MKRDANKCTSCGYNTIPALNKADEEIKRLKSKLDAIQNRLASYEIDEPRWDEDSGYYPKIDLEEALNREHDGDCVKQPQPCIRCFAEHIVHKTKYLLQEEKEEKDG